jgi:ABC-type uncharacterized transport system substrate-binding protein
VARAALGLLTLITIPRDLQAHPHVWVTTRTELVFNKDGRLTSLRHHWEFDEAYSAFAVMGLDNDRDGKPDPAMLAELAKTNVASLAEFSYFTIVQANGVNVAFRTPTEYAQNFDGGKLYIYFILPLKTPVISNTITLKIEDPSYFVALILSDGPDAVTMANAPSNCDLRVRRPETALGKGTQIFSDDIAAALSGRSDTTSLQAEKFVGRIMVSCS